LNSFFLLFLHNQKVIYNI